MNNGYHRCSSSLPAQQRGATLAIGLILLVVITLVGVAAMQGTTLQEKMAGNLRDSNLSFQAAEAALRNCENVLQQDWTLQQALFSNSTVNNPPEPPSLDQTWKLGGPSSSSTSSVWIWSVDNGQAGVLFPGLSGNRLDSDTSNTTPWWAETSRDRTWWWSAGSNSQSLSANSLDEVINPPRCLLEAYVYAVGDASVDAKSWRRQIPMDGLVIKNDISFRRERHFYRNTSYGLGGSNNAVSMLQTGVYLYYYVPE